MYGVEVASATVCRPSVYGEGLLKRCADGDEAAWNALYNQHESTARRFLLRMGVDREAVDDACQEVFLEAFRFLPRFRGECNFKTWLYRLCVTQAREARRRKRARELLWALLRHARGSEVTRGELGAEQAARMVERALSEMTESERVVFALYELEGLSGRETAKIARCPEATVWRRLHHARKRFRAYVDQHGKQS